MCSDSRGTHAVQSFIEAIAEKRALVEAIAELFHQDMLKFAMNKHATHVLIKFIKHVSIHPYLENIYKAIVAHFE